MQPREYSKGGGIDDIWYIGSEWQSPNGNANVTYLIDFKAEWNSNFNWSDNDFNDNYRWLVVGNLLSFPAPSGVFSA